MGAEGGGVEDWGGGRRSKEEGREPVGEEEKYLRIYQGDFEAVGGGVLAANENSLAFRLRVLSINSSLQVFWPGLIPVKTLNQNASERSRRAAHRKSER